MSHSTLIVIDDDTDVLELVSREIALKTDFNVLKMPSGRAALDYIEANKVDFVLSDIRMPGIDGIEIVEQLAGRHDRPEVLLMSGWADVTLAEALDRGAIGMVPKPLRVRDIIDAFLPYQLKPAERWQSQEPLTPPGKLQLHGGKSLEESMAQGPLQFGRSGFFVANTLAQLSEEEHFAFKIRFDDATSIRGRGRAVWSRQRPLHGFLPGAGVLIKSLDEPSIDLLVETVSKNRPRSVVPVGQTIG